MFADLQNDTWANHSHRSYTTFASFALQGLAVSLLLVLPLIYTDRLPLHLTARFLPREPPSSPSAPSPKPHTAAGAVSNLALGGQAIAPTEVPRSIAQIDEQAAPPPVDLGNIGVRGGTGDPRVWNSVISSLGNAFRPVLPPPPKAHQTPRVSHMMEGNLIYRVQPQYPSLARQARIQGSVVLQAVISREGMIEKLQVLSGHPMLVQAAIDAVRQWRYRPYVLNGDPVEVETQVTVNFVLSGG